MRLRKKLENKAGEARHLLYGGLFTSVSWQSTVTYLIVQSRCEIIPQVPLLPEI